MWVSRRLGMPRILHSHSTLQESKTMLHGRDLSIITTLQGVGLPLLTLPKKKIKLVWNCLIKWDMSDAWAETSTWGYINLLRIVREKGQKHYTHFLFVRIFHTRPDHGKKKKDSNLHINKRNKNSNIWNRMQFMRFFFFKWINRNRMQFIMKCNNEIIIM